MTKTMSIDTAIAQLQTAPRQLKTAEAMALIAAQLLHHPVYLSGITAAVPEGFALSDTIALSAIQSLEKEGAIDGVWQKVEGVGRPRRMYHLRDVAKVKAIALLNVCGGGV